MSRPSRLKVLIGAFGDPGHAFPALALGKALRERGHDVTLESWARWREHAISEGLGFAPAPEYQVFPTRGRPLKPYAAAARAAEQTRALIGETAADVVVNDVLTLAARLAAELEGRFCATLVPHVLPMPAIGLPPFGLGAKPPVNAAGRAFWRSLSRLSGAGVARGRRELNETRRRVGLPPLDHDFGGISRDLCLVGTFPQLEYPRSWPEGFHVTGPLMWEPPVPEVGLPGGDEPLVLVAPSTSQDRQQRLLSAAVRGLASMPVRVLATHNRRPPPRPLELPPNASLVEWLSYSHTMPRADLVICHGGHGTLARALASGTPVVAVPAAGDMGENGARLQWAGAGLSLPGRLLSARTLRWTVQTVLADPSYTAKARVLARWSAANDGPSTAAQLVERVAVSGPEDLRPAGSTRTGAAR